jgi:hypothetical protein
MRSGIPYELVEYLPKLRHALAEDDLEGVDFYLEGFVKELNYHRIKALELGGA